MGTFFETQCRHELFCLRCGTITVLPFKDAHLHSCLSVYLCVCVCLCVVFVDLITCYVLSHRTREALACASEMCKKIHTCRSLTVSKTRTSVAQ